MNMKKQTLNSSTKLLAFMYSMFIVVPIYFILGNAYYSGYINSYVFLGALLGLMIIASIPLFIFRKDKFKSLSANWVIILLALFVGNEFLLLEFEAHTYIAEVYREPEEIIQDSHIYALAIGLNSIYYVKEEAMIRDIYERDGIQIYDLYKITNRDRYKSKTNEIKRFLGFGKDQFHIMGENVRDFIREDITDINEFLSRENLRVIVLD